MKRNFPFAAMSAAILLLAVSCGKKQGSTGLLVPEDAAIVVHINNASLSSKLSWDEIRQTNWFKEVLRKNDDTLAAQLLNDPSLTGVDTKADFVFFVKKQGKGSYAVFHGKLKDAAAFEAFITKASENKAEIKKGDFNTVSLGEQKDQNMVLTWNKEHFAYVFEMPMPDMGSKSYKYDSDEDVAVKKFSSDSLAYFGKETLTLGKSDLMDGDDRFVSLIKDGADVHMWMNSEALYPTAPTGMMGFGDFASLLEGNVGGLSLNFDNGKITMDSKNWYGKKLTSFLSKFKAKNVDTDMLGRIPSQNVIAILAMNYPPEAIKEFLKMTSLEPMANMALAQTGYSVDEFVKAMKGDLVVAASDLTLKPKVDSNFDGTVTTKNEPDVKFIFATSVADKGSFEKLITLATDATREQKSMQLSHKLQGDWFVVSNSAEYVDKYLTGGSVKAAYQDKITGHPVGAYVDLQKIMQVAVTDAKDSSAYIGLTESLKIFQDVTVTGGDFKDKAILGHMEVNMMDKSTNSLKQLNAYFDRLYVGMERTGAFKKNDDAALAPADTLIAVPQIVPAPRSN